MTISTEPSAFVRGLAALLAALAATALSQWLPGQGVWMLAAVGASSVLMFVLPQRPAIAAVASDWRLSGVGAGGVTCATWGCPTCPWPRRWR
ncbi:MAG: hypothetical protein MZW92_47935 [Comamonadaceae bacterium]|nr:hypothetical protein [Comamonadaceae bacterium]